MLEFTITFSLQVLRIAMPYLLASLGATYSERSGVINLALEGLMIFGAFGAVIGQYFTGSAWLGIMLAALLGLSVASLHGYMTITIKANQIVSGIALNILAVGVTKFFLRPLFGSSSNSERIAGIDVPNILLNPIFLLAVVLVPLSHFIFYYTPFGLRLRAVGESAQTADSLGINVSAMRYSGVMISGVLAALAGAFLAFEQHSFTDGMTAGRGYIALAAMIIGRWTPLGAAAASLFFAFTEAVQLNLQSETLPTQVVQALPYLITLAVLVGFIGKSTPPSEIGKPYQK
ncbi:MAG: ABC transporter permease [Candidatus Thermochlorobacter aerophilum]|jgi:simple sugar transport system permease protein|uniref:ABC transporter permease n=1 Tax=Candidatus Thermochlorobacter aerophilus TaxID=1868324 RepID=A0A395M3B9_9BACT|nr:MAG: ABC transporter permease [Candidatus Thermochlorobacter aerophilum]